MANHADPPAAMGPQADPSAPTPRRRAEDAAVVLFGGNRSAARGITAELTGFRPTPEQLANAAFLIDLGSDEALVVPAADAHLIPRGDGGVELQERAAAMAHALRRERDWFRRRVRMPDSLLAFAESLLQARSEADVFAALREVSVPVVGAYTAAVYVGAGDGSDAPFQPLSDPALRLPLPPLPAEAVMQFVGQRLVTRADLATGAAGPLAPVAGVLDAAAAAQLLCSPVGNEALLILIERRRDRVLTAEDRDLLAALVRQAEAALRRVVSERQVAALAFTDPETGLPAGRHADLIVDHSLAMARRGHPLALVVVDLQQGQPDPLAADDEDALYWLASAMGEQLRRTDLAVRQGAMRFMMLLTDTDASGARTVLRRLEEQTRGALQLSAGVAEFGPGRDTPEELARAAVQDLEARRPGAA